MSRTIRAVLVTSAMVWTLAVSRPIAQVPDTGRPGGGQTAPSAPPASGPDAPTPRAENGRRPVFNEEGPLETTWDAQFESLWRAARRLPLAALLSAVLAFRPRRSGTPKRQAPVIQTQIILAVVGAVVMLVVGASLARAFGIVGAAGLIRYRAKVEDPKDAGVMLATLAIGLASGVGLYLLAAFATAFVLGLLLLIESIDPAPYALFELTIANKDSARLKDQIEGVLRRRRIPFELRTTAAQELCFEVKLPLTTSTEAVSAALTELNPKEPLELKWEQKKDKN